MTLITSAGQEDVEAAAEQEHLLSFIMPDWKNNLLPSESVEARANNEHNTIVEMNSVKVESK